MTKHCRDESNGCAAVRCTCKCSVCDPRTKLAKIMDWITGDGPPDEVPPDFLPLPPISLALETPQKDLHIVPLAKVHPEKVKKLHAVLHAKKPKKGKRK